MDTKINKALLIIIMAALIISLVFTGSVAAVEGLIISAASVEGVAGGKVIVNVTVEKVAGSEGGQFTLTFDKSLVRPVLIEPGELVLSAENSLHMANLDYAPGELIFMWVTANADTEDSGIVCKLTFDLLKEGTSLIDFKDLIIVAESGDSAKAFAGQILIIPAAQGQGTVTEPSQAAESSGTESESGEGVAGEEIVGEDDVTTEKADINPILIFVLMIIIALLAVVYYLIKKSGKKTI